MRRAALLALLSALVLVAPAQAAFPGKNGKIAYFGPPPSSGSDCIYTVNPDGTGQTPVGSCPAPFGRDYPAWSPDGKVIAYDDANTIATMNADGSQDHDIYDTGTVVGIGWSPDGSKIVFSVTDFCGSCTNDADIWTVRPDGTGASDLTNTPDLQELNPDWSPDGTMIAFGGRQCPGGFSCSQSDIYTMSPSGLGVADLTNTPNSYEGAPSWSPDGRKIAFVRERDIWTMNADGTDQTNVTNSADPVVNFQPAWSPDGTKIVFASSRSPAGLYVMNADGSDVTQLTTPGNEPDWQPLPITYYPRPKGATPFQTYLTVAYKPCISPNEQHGAPLASDSCSPPVQSSDYLTVGTLDSNGQKANSVGSVRYDVKVGSNSTPADVKLAVSILDVRNKPDLSDYTGELLETSLRRIIDKNNTPAPDGTTQAATVTDIPFSATIPCTATSDTTIGSSCALATTANALVPGQVTANLRSIWQLDQVQVYDGGADGSATTAYNTLFADEGIFAP